MPEPNELTEEQIMWIKALIKEYPKHISTAPETVELLNEKYVRKWVITTAFGFTFALMGIIYNAVDNTKTKLDVYKNEMWATVIETNKEITIMKEDISGIKANLNNLTNVFNKFDISVE